ncbi:MAG: hypothetical protein K8T91_20150 [Planctomycetes bacterium]|nr:hypothetical protein [Planctomycetota bacterium]
MKYTIRWRTAAEEELAKIWLSAHDRAVITQAAREIDRVLEFEPESVGESRPHGRRVTHVAPLGVTFQIFPAQRIVRVVEIWQFRVRQ